MTNYERIMKYTPAELAIIMKNEFCAVCNCCLYYHTTKCRYDDEYNTINPNACEKGIEEWLNSKAENN